MELIESLMIALNFFEGANIPAKSKSLPSTPIKSPPNRDVTNLVEILSPQRVQAERDSVRMARVAKQLLYDESKDDSQLSLSAKALLEGFWPSLRTCFPCAQ